MRLDWVEFVITELRNWKNFYIKWLEDFKKPILLITYENLLIDRHCQLERIIHFLKQPVYHRRLFKCAFSKQNDRFKRAGHLYTFDPFSIYVNGSSLRKLVDKERRSIYKHINEKFGNQLTCKKENKVSKDKIG